MCPQNFAHGSLGLRRKGRFNFVSGAPSLPATAVDVTASRVPYRLDNAHQDRSPCAPQLGGADCAQGYLACPPFHMGFAENVSKVRKRTGEELTVGRAG